MNSSHPCFSNIASPLPEGNKSNLEENVDLVANMTIHSPTKFHSLEAIHHRIKVRQNIANATKKMLEMVQQLHKGDNVRNAITTTAAYRKNKLNNTNKR
jgi:hypothetical protein